MDLTALAGAASLTNGRTIEKYGTVGRVVGGNILEVPLILRGRARWRCYWRTFICCRYGRYETCVVFILQPKTADTAEKYYLYIYLCIAASLLGLQTLPLGVYERRIEEKRGDSR